MMQLHFWPIVQCLILLTCANGVPVLAKKLLGGRFAWPIDGGWLFWDGQPFFGKSKTLRGVVLAIVCTAVASPIVQLEMETGALIGLMAMAGDIASSFLKRRLQLAPSSKAPGLDQVPESLFPFLAVKGLLEFSAWDILVGVGAFWVGELIVSKFLYALRIRDRPY